MMALHPRFTLILCGNLIEAVALINSDPNLLKVKSSDFRNFQPFQHAVLNRKYDICKKLLELGADVNFQDDTGMTPLHYAARKGLSEIAKLLIDNGANIDSVEILNNATPLHLACKTGHLMEE